MAYDSKYYWENKEGRARLAQHHTAKMETQYKQEIEDAFRNSKVFRGVLPDFAADRKRPDISLVNTDTVSALFAYHTGKTAVLNFASYKNPGGMFLNGSRAQEECLCHASTLYNVLSRGTDFYQKNKKDLNRSLYKNAAVYSPNIRFFDGKKMIRADVITCAAPNWSAASRYGMATLEENNAALAERIRFIRIIAEKRNVNTIILGAFGCGVFGQNPAVVATMFSREFEKTTVDKVIFAVPGDDKNYHEFFRIINSSNN